METMWAPWRSQYMAGLSKEKTAGDTTCVFCDALAKNQDSETFIVRRGLNVFSILNLFPYNLGHLLVLPNQHLAELSDLSPEVFQELMGMVYQGHQVLMDIYRPHGINIGANLGSAAGAGIAQHLHFHILPRWTSDVNYVTTIGHTRVISESLDNTWEKISEKWESLYGKA